MPRNKKADLPDTPKVPDYDLFTFKTKEEGSTEAEQYGSDAMARTYGSDNSAVNSTLFCQSLQALSENEQTDGSSDVRAFMPAIVREIAPRDAIEQMLAVQMAVTHVALIRQGRRLARSDLLPQLEANERAFNKLARTYAAQMDALRKHRNGGKQVVQVQHVNVEDGGQAIVGNV